MIFTKYILKEIFKNQLIILTLLFLVCFCQKLIRMLGLVIDSNISIYLIFLCLGLSMPESGKLLIPFSVFLSVLVTFYRLHAHNEIIAMYSCAVDKYIFLRSMFVFSWIVATFTMINIAWLSPYCSSYQSRLLYKIKENINLVVLSEKKFQPLVTKYLILFAGSIQGSKLKNVFLSKINPDKDNNMFIIITSDQGSIRRNPDGSRLIILENGTYYEIYNKCELCKDVLITDFSQYQMLINNTIKTLYKENESVDHMSMHQLWCSDKLEMRVELHWRLTLLVSIFLMPMIATLLITVVSYNYLVNLLVTVFLYIIFFIFHILLRSCVLLDNINPIVWMWVINSIYLSIVLLLNSWDTSYIKKLVLTMCYRHHIKI
ncbi:LPS export ABC transporter permease LptF [Blochmannia endosymbiont of Camponotus sp.]|uniref:LPS export ABC transporter permease LptF n=1 Tax=Blochmannia endosymbiont of Camponotus sp. TaxID=700220 RepID=UPI002023BC81|nr:LPS export ABC transporter permease LptF [Blochmannia endosymbiont of Camponotus sp.]URJ32264.1 LPS export ABC transporter permease LptF [Blochmannia endosymbiont of Camponotus sp.]